MVVTKKLPHFRLLLAFSFIFLQNVIFSNGILPELTSKKNGVLFGLQMGKYTGFEIGGEQQWKTIKIKDPLTKAINGVFEYQFKAQTIGLKVGGWVKTSRLGFTYGGSFTFLTDFSYTRFGITPTLGYRILNFHGYLGLNLTAGPKVYEAYNKLHIGVRVYLNKSRDIEINKKKKKKN